MAGYSRVERHRRLTFPIVPVVLVHGLWLRLAPDFSSLRARIEVQRDFSIFELAHELNVTFQTLKS